MLYRKLCICLAPHGVKHAVFASDDEDVPEYLVYIDDEPELEMIGIADESKT